MAAVAGSNIVAFKSAATSAKFGDRKIGQFRQWSTVPVQAQPPPCLELKRRWSSSLASSGTIFHVSVIVFSNVCFSCVLGVKNWIDYNSGRS